MRQYTRALTEDELRQMYWEEHLSEKDISRRTGVSVSNVHHLMRVYGIERRTLSESVKYARMAKKSSYVGRKQSQEEIAKRVATRKRNHTAIGVTTGQKGYLRYTTGKYEGRLVHVVIMENHIGRKLLPGECVHHINGNKQDNRIENLRLMKMGEHSTLHNNLNAQHYRDLFSGEKSVRSKLTQAQVNEIYSLKGKMSGPKVGEMFGVTSGNIYHIWHGRTWKENNQ